MTKCCTNTSSGCCGDERASIWPLATAARAAAASMISKLWVGTSVMRDGLPGAWPERPARCSSRATPLGEPICSTRSTGRKSTPKSRLDVHTTHRSSPLFSPASTHARTPWSSEPWCSAISPAQSGRACKIAWYHSSDWERVLVNTSVVLLAAISLMTCGSIVSPKCPAHGKRWATSGSSVSMMSFLGSAPCTKVPPLPKSVCMACSKLPRVADMPQITSAGLNVLNLAKANCVCTPRLLPISSCHSSTTTALTLFSASRASARDSSTDKLSGVVTSTVGKRVFCALRSALDVSPLRAPTVHKAKLPSAFSASSGTCNARWVSAASARIGVIHNTVSGAPIGFLFTPDLGAVCALFNWATAIYCIKIPSQTAYVLPEPVVACSSPDWPRRTACHTSFWNLNACQPRWFSHSVMADLIVLVAMLLF